jgi:hypothetical protein
MHVNVLLVLSEKRGMCHGRNRDGHSVPETAMDIQYIQYQKAQSPVLSHFVGWLQNKE